MSVLVVGLNHRTAELAVLDRLAVPADEVPKALRSLTALDHVIEAVLLSTCNRVEVYAHVSRFHPGLAELLGWLSARGGLDLEQHPDLYYVHYDERAAAHLFAVSAGIDSMIVGERQIALQVRQAGELARREGASGRILQKLFREAVRIGRRVRQQTSISDGAGSMVDVAVDAAMAASGGDLVGRTALVAGAGKVGALAVERLVSLGADVMVWNRTPERARRLAARRGARAVRDLLGALPEADLVVCAAAVSSPLLEVEDVAEALAGRDRPMVLVDLAVPRNVAPGVAALDGVTVVDIDTVRRAVCERTVAGEVVAQVQAIVEEEALRFAGWLRAVQVEPTIRALRARAEDIRRAELERLSGRLAGLDDRQREAVEALTRGIINTLLHEPTVRLKALADRGGAEHYANALRELFDLDE